MKYNLSNLFVNMPCDDFIGYVFGLPENMYTTVEEAVAEQEEGEKTVTLGEAFKRIADNIHYDS
jgi:hypothetical protein